MKIISPQGLGATTKILTDDDFPIDGVLDIVITGSGAGIFVANMSVRMKSCNLYLADGHIRVVTQDKDGLTVEWGELQERRIKNLSKYLEKEIPKHTPGIYFSPGFFDNMAREIVVGLREGDYDS